MEVLLVSLSVNTEEEKTVSVEKRERSVSIKAIILSLLFLCFLAFIFTRGELTYGLDNAVLQLVNPVPNSGSLGPVILVVLLLNPLLGRIGKRFQFSKTELLTVYAVLLIGAPIIGVGLVGYFPFQLMGLHGLSLINPKTYGGLLDKLSTLLLPKSEDAIWGFLYGEAKVPWGDWIIPLLIWMVFWAVVFFWMLCIASLVRKQWTEYEHLRYPIAEASFKALNVDVVKKEYGSTKLLWIGFVGSALFIALERLSYYFPAFPQFKGRWLFHEIGWALAKLSPVIDEAFRNHWWMPEINLIVLGIGYLVRTDLLFSVWFFYLLKYALLVLYASRGLLDYHGIPNLYTQTSGAFLALGIYLIWLGRHDIGNIFKKAFKGNKTNIDDADEPLSYRLVVFGGFAAVCFIVLFNAVFLHVSPLITLVLLLFVFVCCLTVARIRGDAGIGWGWLYGIPIERYIIPVLGGASAWDMTSVVNYSGPLYNIGKVGLGTATASSLELYKMADLAGMKKKTMAAVIMFGFLAAFVIGFGVVLPYIYGNGGMMLSSHFVNWGYNGWWIHGTLLPESGQAHIFQFSSVKLGYFVGAGVLTSVLMFLSTSYAWWPLHPLGYVASHFSGYFVGGFFIAWLVKVLVLRYGGFETYKKFMPLFIGLIAGQVFAETIDGLIRLVSMI
jgi:hypothetical protein